MSKDLVLRSSHRACVSCTWQFDCGMCASEMRARPTSRSRTPNTRCNLSSQPAIDYCCVLSDREPSLTEMTSSSPQRPWRDRAEEEEERLKFEDATWPAVSCGIVKYEGSWVPPCLGPVERMARTIQVEAAGRVRAVRALPLHPTNSCSNPPAKHFQLESFRR